MENGIQVVTFEEHVRKRPFMYFGSLVGLFTNVMADCITLCGTDEIRFTIVVAGTNRFSIHLFTKCSLEPFLASLDRADFETGNYHGKVLKVISEDMEIKTAGTTTTIHFRFDTAVVPKTAIDFQELSENMLQFALLNRRSEIILKDRRRKFLNQVYYHFPEGVFYLFERAIKDALGKPELKISLDMEIAGFTFQAGLAYRTDWYPPSHVLSFANDIHTFAGGSLVDGVLNGLVAACKAYAKEKEMTTCNVKRRKCHNGLILVCLIRGNVDGYDGSVKQVLADKQVEKLARQLIKNKMLEYFRLNEEQAMKFLWRFDDSQLGSKMY